MAVAIPRRALGHLLRIAVKYAVTTSDSSQEIAGLVKRLVSRCPVSHIEEIHDELASQDGELDDGMCELLEWLDGRLDKFR